VSWLVLKELLLVVIGLVLVLFNMPLLMRSGCDEDTGGVVYVDAGDIACALSPESMP
jgi:hypothetical protein